MKIYKDGPVKIVSATGEEVRTSLKYHLEYYFNPKEKTEIIEKYNLSE